MAAAWTSDGSDRSPVGHASQGEIAVVHNGIVENHEAQRERLKRLGYGFESQTDTEVVAHLIHYYFRETRDLLVATQRAVRDLVGAYAIAVVSRTGMPSIHSSFKINDSSVPPRITASAPSSLAMRLAMAPSPSRVALRTTP